VRIYRTDNSGLVKTLPGPPKEEPTKK
jgi:hypothetical protein